jgi:polysaccharide export outer membrane protein
MRRQTRPLSRFHRARSPRLLVVCALLILPGASAAATAQTIGSATPSRAQGSESYRIGPGDVLDVRVFNRPQLSRDAVRVGGDGMIRMPLIEGEIRASCRTETDLAREIEARYVKYLRSPHVDVFVKEFQSQPVAVIGAVNLPGRFQLQRPMRLLELLTFAGGPSDRAGARVHVAHAAAPAPCEAQTGAAAAAGENVADALTAYRLNETLRGVDQANPYVRPGDIVNLPEAEQAFVVGNVLRPMAVDLREPVTISRAIAMAGGLMPDTRREKIRILRQSPGKTEKTEIIVDLGAVEKRQAEDVALEADDIVDVPTASGKRILRSLVSGIFPAAGQLPVQVIAGQVPTAATRRH